MKGCSEEETSDETWPRDGVCDRAGGSRNEEVAFQATVGRAQGALAVFLEMMHQTEVVVFLISEGSRSIYL